MRRSVLRVMVITLSALVLAYGSLCALMFFAQRSMLYHPTPAHDVAGLQPLLIPSGGETLRVWQRPVQGSDALIYFGGNGEDVLGAFEDLAGALPQHSLYVVNYRGYGGSTGSPAEESLFEDALAVFDAVRARHANVSVAGRSLGSGVAVYLASQRAVTHLVLLTPYDSIENVAKQRFPFLPVGLLLRDRYDSASRIAGIKAKTLVVIAANDEVILRARSDALVAKFPADQVRVEIVRGVTHNMLEYRGLLAAFLAR